MAAPDTQLAASMAQAVRERNGADSRQNSLTKELIVKTITYSSKYCFHILLFPKIINHARKEKATQASA
jgi:hypothetical protein